MKDVTLQGCSLSSGFYDVGIKPLAEEIKNKETIQIWQCDDLSACGEAKNLKEWLRNLRKRSPAYGYKTKRGKCYLISKDNKVAQGFRTEIEEGTLKVQRRTRYLGALTGDERFKKEFYKNKLEDINKKVAELTELARPRPRGISHVHNKH